MSATAMNPFTCLVARRHYSDRCSRGTAWPPSHSSKRMVIWGGPVLLLTLDLHQPYSLQQGSCEGHSCQSTCRRGEGGQEKDGDYLVSPVGGGSAGHRSCPSSNKLWQTNCTVKVLQQDSVSLNYVIVSFFYFDDEERPK